MAEAGGVGQSQHPHHPVPAQPAIASRHGLIGHAQDLGDVLQRCSPVELKGVHEAEVQLIQIMGFHLRKAS